MTPTELDRRLGKIATELENLHKGLSEDIAFAEEIQKGHDDINKMLDRARAYDASVAASIAKDNHTASIFAGAIGVAAVVLGAAYVFRDK